MGECSICSQREQLCPRQSYDVSFILSVWCLSSSLLLPLNLYVSLTLDASPVEAVMKPSSLHHTRSPAARGLLIHSHTVSFKTCHIPPQHKQIFWCNWFLLLINAHPTELNADSSILSRDIKDMKTHCPFHLWN